MGTLSIFFWKDASASKDTYIYGIPTAGLALEMGRALQGASSADLDRIDFTPSGVCLPSGTGRRYEYALAPVTDTPDLSAYKRPGVGVGMGVFFCVYLLLGGKTRTALSAPSPRLALLNDPAAMQAMAEEWRRAYSNAVKVSGLAVSGWRIIAPKQYRKAFDGLTWFE